MDERTRRIGQNEAIFRNVNDRLRELGATFSLVSEHASFVCECGSADCLEQVRMTLEEYERVRSDPTLFAIIERHEIPEVEAVVERTDRYVVVKKHEGAPAQLARETA